MVKCPRCGSAALRRSHARSTAEREQRKYDGVRFFRCKDCKTRFSHWAPPFLLAKMLQSLEDPSRHPLPFVITIVVLLMVLLGIVSIMIQTFETKAMHIAPTQTNTPTSANKSP